ncbi:unnamed protein product [Closterium sp. NIES-53]
MGVLSEHYSLCFYAVEPVEVTGDSGAARGAEPGGADSGGAEPGGAATGGTEPGGAELGGAMLGGAVLRGAEPGGAEPGGALLGGAEPGGALPGGAPPGCAATGGAELRGTPPGGSLGASSLREQLSPQELREWFARRWRRAAGAGAGAAEGVGTETTAGGPAGGKPGAAGGSGAAGGAAGEGAPAGGTGTVLAVSGVAVRPRPYFVPLLEQVLGSPPSTGLPPSLACPQPVPSQLQLQPTSPLPTPSPYTGPTGGLAERREPASRPASPVRAARTSRRGSRQRPPPVLGTHRMSLRPSTAPLRAPLPSPPESPLPALADPAFDSLRAASPTVARLLATVVTDPSFESTAASALVAELVDFAARCRLDYAASLFAESASVCPPSVGGEYALGTYVLEDRQEEFQCLAAASPHLVSVLLTPEGDPDALDIPTPRSYAEAIEGPYSSQWQAAMDAEMASWKSTGTYVDAVPPPGANIVSGMWIFRVKRPPGSPPVFKARYVAPASRPASPARPASTSRRTSRQRPPAVPGTHQMTLRPSTAPLRVPLPSPPASSLPVLADPGSDSLRAASPAVAHFLATVVTDPSLESTAASALVAELVDFAARCRLDYAASLVAESVSVCPPSVGGECALSTDVLEDRQEEFQCFAAALPHLVSTLLAPEGDPDAPDIPTPRSYAEAIEGPYSSQWQAAMDAEMASWKSTGTYVDEVPPPGANIVSGMWIFRVKRPPGSPPFFKARYVARGFSQRQGVNYFQTFSPTPKMTTLRVLLHVAAHRDYELHSLDFSTAFLQGSLHEEIWLRRPLGFTGTFPPGTQWSLRRPVYGLRQAPREWHNTLRTTLAALGFAPSTADPSLFLRTDTSLPPFYILVYVDDLVFATADTAGLAHVKSELQKRHTCTDLGELRSYLGLQITWDRSRRTITLTQSHMVQQVLLRFGFTYSSPQATPLPTRHSLSALPSDESVESSGPYPELVGCLMYLMTCTRPDLAYPLSILARYVAPGRHRPEHMAAAKRVLRYLCSTSGMGLVLGGRSPVVLTGHADASWADDQATQRSSQGAMAAQELRLLTYLLTDLGEQPRSPPQHGQLRLAFVATRANTADIFTKALSPGIGADEELASGTGAVVVASAFVGVAAAAIVFAATDADVAAVVFAAVVC